MDLRDRGFHGCQPAGDLRSEFFLELPDAARGRIELVDLGGGGLDELVVCGLEDAAELGGAALVLFETKTNPLAGDPVEARATAHGLGVE